MTKKIIGGPLNVPSDKKQVTIYVTANCSRCKQLESWLDSHHIAYQVRNLEDAEVITDLRLAGIFCLESPMLQIGEKFYTPIDLFRQNGSVDVEAIRGLLEAA
jgi:glutaredoxin